MTKKDYNRIYKMEVMEAYKNRTYPCCRICGISDIDMLAIDHIDNNGNKHFGNQNTRLTGTSLYRWLINNGFPEGFQILCHNHNKKKDIINRRNNKK